MDLAQRLPRVWMRVEPFEEKKVDQHARHPVDRRSVADDGAATGRLQEPSREPATGLSPKHATTAEVHQAVVGIISTEGITQLVRPDRVENGGDTSRRAVEREVIDGSVPDFRLPPEKTPRPLRVVREPAFRLDEPMRDLQGRAQGRPQGLEKSPDRDRVEQPVIPVRLEADEL